MVRSYSFRAVESVPQAGSWSFDMAHGGRKKVLRNPFQMSFDAIERDEKGLFVCILSILAGDV